MKNLDKLKVEGKENISIPPMYKVEQLIFQHEMEKPVEKLKKKLNGNSCDLTKIIKPGDKVAICTGSRGIDKLYQLVETTIKQVKKAGGNPIIIPAMGSHGGAEAAGQRSVLESYGITEANLNTPIEASLETINFGHTQANNIKVFFSKTAYECDHIILINRIKVHTDYSGEFESGILKMMTIGLGKHSGATTLHSYGMENFPWVIPEAANLIMKKAPISLGIGLLENGNDKLADIGVWQPDEILEMEAKMLVRQKELMPKIPFEKIDLLIIDEMGKDISGSGIDPNIIGRQKEVEVEINKIFVRNLTENSHGNATGIGMADFITRDLFRKVDLGSTYTNLITSRVVDNAKIPMIVRNDLEAIKIAIKVSLPVNEINSAGENFKILRMKNTLNLNDFEVSKSLLREVNENNNLNLKSKKPIKQWIKNRKIKGDVV